MEVEEERVSLTLMVTSLQRETIYHLFHHHNWDIQEVPHSEAAITTVQGVSEPDGDPEFIIQQRYDADECPHCLCKPCITDPVNKQMWWEEDILQEHPRNSELRKGHYKRFWTMLLHRGVWRDVRYQERKRQALEV